jgi:hypothetical protein
MVKKKITKSVKKQVKNKNINIKINIDQSKRTTGSIPKKSNIRTLPAYSSAPSSGGNYVRQFVQDPYYSESQYENLLKQYNNLVRKNNPQITSGSQDNKPATRVLDSEKNKNRNYPKITNDFTDKNQNEQQLVKASKYDDDESVTEKFIDNAMYDDPRTNGDPQNAIYNFKSQTAQKLPTTQNEFPEDEDEQLLLESSVSDPYLKLMYSDREYDDKGFKIFRESDIKPNKYFNKSTGKWVLGYGQEINKLREANQGSVESKFTRDPYSINLILRDPTTNLNARNTEWRNYIKKVKEKQEEPQEMPNEETPLKGKKKNKSLKNK